MNLYAAQALYLAASALFIMGLRGLGHPETARRGMQLAQVGMLCAIVGTLLNHEIIRYEWIIISMIVGSAIGAAMAILMPMTAVPQRTAVSHMFGAVAAVLVGITEYMHDPHLSAFKMGALGFEVLFGTITITGSFMAFGKLQGFVRSPPITYKFQNITNIGLFIGAFAIFVTLILQPTAASLFYLLIALGLLVGVLIVLPIGGADMPVVLSLLNSYAGLASAATGFALSNYVLIIAGALDGTSGFFLSVQIVDLRASSRQEGEGARGRGGEGAMTTRRVGSEGVVHSPTRPLTPSILSRPLIEGIQKRLERAEQTILLLNRRGYSTFVQCRECGHVWQCEQCNVSLTFHRARRRIVCHYCFREHPAPVVCPDCHSGDIAYRGIGTEQVERTVAETFPSARIARMDVDTTSAKWSHHEILGRFEKGEVDILLGTQMIAKGLDFPRVTLVGVVNADVSMNLPDFRAGERTFQLLTQVAGRAGRGAMGGDVIVQTSLPNHYAIRAAIEHDYIGFAERELEERRSPLYPPLCRLANIVISGLEEAAVQKAAEEAARFISDADPGPGLELIGPAPCPIDRVRGRWRWHFILRSTGARVIARACRQLLLRHTIKPGKAELRLILDRDPVSLM